MSDYLGNLVTKCLNLEPPIQPRPVSLFESSPATTRSRVNYSARLETTERLAEAAADSPLSFNVPMSHATELSPDITAPRMSSASLSQLPAASLENTTPVAVLPSITQPRKQAELDTSSLLEPKRAMPVLFEDSHRVLPPATDLPAAINRAQSQPGLDIAPTPTPPLIEPGSILAIASAPTRQSHLVMSQLSPGATLPPPVTIQPGLSPALSQGTNTARPQEAESVQTQMTRPEPPTPIEQTPLASQMFPGATLLPPVTIQAGFSLALFQEANTDRPQEAGLVQTQMIRAEPPAPTQQPPLVSQLFPGATLPPPVTIQPGLSPALFQEANTDRPQVLEIQTDFLPPRLMTPSITPERIVVKPQVTLAQPPGPANFSTPVEPAVSPPEPIVHVTIGRIEVRATPPPVKAKRETPSKHPNLSLDDYLQRYGGKG